MKYASLGLLLLFASPQIVHACSDPLWAKCPDGECSLRADNDPATLAAALKVAQGKDACVGSSVAIYRVTSTGGGTTEVDHFFTVTAEPATSTADLIDEGFTVDHTEVPVKPRTPAGTQWGLVQLVFSNWQITFPCEFPCF